MTSIMQSLPTSAVRKQSTVISSYLQNAAQPVASSGTRSSMSAHCFQSRSISSQTPFSSRVSSLSSAFTHQRRTFLAQLKRQSQTFKESTPSTNPPPAAAKLQLTNLPYFVRRTPSNQLPVYLVTKAGGTKQQTKVQKTEGDLDSFRNDLACYLGLESGERNAAKSSDISINRLTGHITVRGWRKAEIQKFLLERHF